MIKKIIRSALMRKFFRYMSHTIFGTWSICMLVGVFIGALAPVWLLTIIAFAIAIYAWN